MVLLFFLNEQIVGAHHAGLQKIFLLDKVIADERAGNQTERCCRGGNGGGSRYAHVFEHGAERTCRAVATNHRDRASCKADERVDTDHIRDRNGDHVLRFDKEEHAEQENDQCFSAALQHLHVRLETDRSEEDHHADILKGVVPLEVNDVGSVEHARDDREEQAAYYWRGNAEAVEHLDLGLEPSADEQRHNGDRKRLIHIERNLSHRRSL